MVFVLTSVAHQGTVRSFTFELAGAGPVRKKVVVVADLTLARKYNIPLQELPLLCLQLLEGRPPELEGTLSFGESDMVQYDHTRSELKSAAERKRLAHRTPKPGVTGNAWRPPGQVK
jgi:hypothetical protein